MIKLKEFTTAVDRNGVKVIPSHSATESSQTAREKPPRVVFDLFLGNDRKDARGRRFREHRALSSLQEYVMIDETEHYIEYYRREGQFWILETIEEMEAILKVRSLDLEIPLSEIYEKVALPSE
jgi:Uma2 family endonuclease